MAGRIYSKATKELMEEFAAETLQPGQVFAKDSVVEWFAQHYPLIKPSTVSAHVECMAVNNKGVRQHLDSIRPGTGYDLFMKVGPNQFRLWDRTRDPEPAYAKMPIDALSPDHAAETEESRPSRATFAREQFLENFLLSDLAMLEPGLSPYTGENNDFDGKQFPVDNGRIDILAVDASGRFTVIELKASRGHERTIGQLAYYMRWVEDNIADGAEVRGIIVAGELPEKLRKAASKLSNVTIYTYQINPVFKREPI